jgi:integrase
MAGRSRRSSDGGDRSVPARERRLHRALCRRLAQEGAIYLFAAFTGLRRGELPALRWREVDLDGSIIRVHSSYGRVSK